MRLKLIICLILILLLSGCDQSDNFEKYLGDYPISSYSSYALKTADFILNLQDSNGAIPDEPGGDIVNLDSTMEYALFGLAAAYRYSKDDRYLLGLEKGIEWLAEREELTDPIWQGSWRYAFQSSPPYNPMAVSPGKGISDVGGVSASSALFVYLVYLHSELTNTTNLPVKYETHARLALEFIIKNNMSSDGFYFSSWHKWKSDGKWHLWRFRYTADQGDVLLGMHAGWLLYGDNRYRDAAIHLRKYVSEYFFNDREARYATGIEEDGVQEMEMSDFNAIFPQGYYPWIRGKIDQNKKAYEWLNSRVQPDGRIKCYKSDPGYSLSVAMLALSAYYLVKPAPVKSMEWVIKNTYDPSDGGIRDTISSNSPKYSNVAGFMVAAFLQLTPFPCD